MTAFKLVRESTINDDQIGNLRKLDFSVGYDFPELKYKEDDAYHDEETIESQFVVITIVTLLEYASIS